MLRPVPQRDGMGCSVACVAFIAGVSYVEARDYFTNWKNRIHGNGFPPRMVVKALKRAHISIKSEGEETNTPEDLPNRTIIRVKRSEDDDDLHYVVKDHGRFIDPLDDHASKKARKKPNSGGAADWKAQSRGQVRRVWPVGWRVLSYITTGT